MKKMMVLALATVLATGIVMVTGDFINAQPGHGPGFGAAGPQGPGGPPQGEPNPGRRGGFDLIRFVLRHLDLSDEQKAQIQAILEVHRAAVEPLQEALRENREALHELTAGGAFFENEIEISDLAAEQGDLLGLLLIERERVKAEVYGVLTDEQKEQLEKYLKMLRNFMEEGPGFAPEN